MTEDWGDEDEGNWLDGLSPYELEELERAVMLDDGARALELLRRVLPA